MLYPPLLSTFYYRKASLSFFLTTPLHLSATDVAFLIDEVKITFLFFNAAVMNYLSSAAFFCAACHLCFISASVFTYKIEETLLPLDAAFAYHFSHSFHPPS